MGRHRLDRNRHFFLFSLLSAFAQLNRTSGRVTVGLLGFFSLSDGSCIRFGYDLVQLTCVCSGGLLLVERCQRIEVFDGLGLPEVLLSGRELERFLGRSSSLIPSISYIGGDIINRGFLTRLILL